jgi:hypothetical protein
MNWTDAIPLLGTYPIWARIVVVACVVIMIGVLVLTPRQPEKASPPRTGEGISVGSQSAAVINNIVQQPSTSTAPTLSPSQERLLMLIADYQQKYAANKLIISRTDGRLFFDGNPDRGKEVSLVRDLYGAIDFSKQKDFVDLMDSMPPEYLRVFLETRYGSPFAVGITDSGSNYIRKHQ